MKKAKILLAVLTITATLTSCKKSEYSLANFKNECNLNHKLIELDKDSYFSIVFQLFIAKDKLLVYDVDTKYYFSVVDLNSKKIIEKIGVKGQGPNEIVGYPMSVSKIGSTEFCFYDIYKRKLSVIDISEKNKSTISEFKNFKPENSIFNVLPTYSGTYITLGLFEKGRYLLLDAEGKELSYYFDYPKINNGAEFSNKNKAMAFQGILKSRPDNKRFVFATRYSEIIEITELTKKNELKKVFEWHGDLGKFVTDDSKKNSFSAAITQDTKATFRDVNVTSEYIYLLYSGHSFSEGSNSVTKCKSIYVIDWDGNPILKFNLDVNVTCIAVSEDNKTMYAIVEGDDTQLVKFVLKNL